MERSSSHFRTQPSTQEQIDYTWQYGVNQQNINNKLEIAKSNPNQTSLRRFLGIDGGLGNKLGLSNDFVVNIIKATGNYGEIYDRNLRWIFTIALSGTHNNKDIYDINLPFIQFTLNV